MGVGTRYGARESLHFSYVATKPTTFAAKNESEPALRRCTQSGPNDIGNAHTHTYRERESVLCPLTSGDILSIMNKLQVRDMPKTRPK